MRWRSVTTDGLQRDLERERVRAFAALRADAILDAIASCQDCIVGEPHVCPVLGVEQ